MSRDNEGRAFVPPDNRTSSEHFAAFLDHLRNTGTDLPMKNSEIATMVAEALDTGTGYDLATADILARDMEVIAGELKYREENFDD